MTAVAVASAFPVLATPSIAAEAATKDPIFAAIERHRAAYYRRLKTGYLYGLEDRKMPHQNKEALRKLDDACTEGLLGAEEAALRLSRTQPTTKAGLIALLGYIDHFNAHGVALKEDPKLWHSDTGYWPSEEIEDAELSMSRFPFDVLSSIRAALRDGIA